MRYPRVLTVQDLSCAGQCSLTVALPVLSACGAETCVLPTAVLSTHTGGLGRPYIRDLTEDMPHIAAHWENAEIRFDMISCGYLGSVEQMEQVERVFDRLVVPGCVKVIDPAMADPGTLYAGFDDAFVEGMKRFCIQADWLLPNLTEACLLTGSEYRTNYGCTYIDELLKKLSAMGCKGIVLTGVSFDEATTGAVIWEQGRSTYYRHERLERNCHGTGDIFAAVFTGALAKGKTASEAVKIAADYTLACMKLTMAENTRPYGVMFEPLLGELIRSLQG